jgi:hypothetical protein
MATFPRGILTHRQDRIQQKNGGAMEKVIKVMIREHLRAGVFSSGRGRPMLGPCPLTGIAQLDKIWCLGFSRNDIGAERPI